MRFEYLNDANLSLPRVFLSSLTITSHSLQNVVSAIEIFILYLPLVGSINENIWMDRSKIITSNFFFCHFSRSLGIDWDGIRFINFRTWIFSETSCQTYKDGSLNGIFFSANKASLHQSIWIFANLVNSLSICLRHDVIDCGHVTKINEKCRQYYK